MGRKHSRTARFPLCPLWLKVRNASTPKDTKVPKENAVDSAGSEENEVRTGPERGGNAAARPGRKNNVVVIGRLQAFDHRRQRLRRRDRQMGEKPVNVRAAAVALRDKRDVRVLAGEVPAQRCRQRD